MHLTALYTYPIKSLAGISLTEARMEKRGVAYDRRWMLVDQKGLFISQRKFPEMALLLPEFSEKHLIIRHRFKGLEPLAIPLHPPEGSKKMEVQVWDDHCWISKSMYPRGLRCWTRKAKATFDASVAR